MNVFFSSRNTRSLSGRCGWRRSTGCGWWSGSQRTWKRCFTRRPRQWRYLFFLLKSLISSKLQYNTTPIKAQQNVMYVMHCCAEPHDKLKLCNYKEWVFFRCVGRSVTKAKSAGLRLVKSLGAVVISDHCADPIGCLKRCCHVTLPECNKTHLGFAVCERDMWETWRGGGTAGEVTDRERLWSTNQCLCHFIDPLRSDIGIYCKRPLKDNALQTENQNHKLGSYALGKYLGQGESPSSHS